ncbi:hypothetical protein C5167_047658 [Papaver somniferum]|uniref:Uncharacterized protein n=1 Tax=Papaver somniferum TaxID=3469 RepID=A0A4Y7LKY2_PAPSO|nr:hypothetical protein C5167_047658 [Papaver somniferum]
MVMQSLVFVEMVMAYSDGQVKVYELNDPFGTAKMATSASAFEKPSCLSASISWNQQRGEGNPLTFALGFNSDLPQFNSSKRWYRLQSWHWRETRVIKFILLLGHPILAGVKGPIILKLDS